MAPTRILQCFLGVVALAAVVIAHEGEPRKPVQAAPDADWQTRHMAEEHHITIFDPNSFFTLHDYDENGHWDEEEVLKTYGMMDESALNVTKESRDKIVVDVFALIDKDHNRQISREEWIRFSAQGGILPDFGLGPGHHGDDEYEYEIHHWERYHDENTREEDLIHPEDIAHFAKHDLLDDEADRVAELDKLSIVDQNIPKMFRKEL